MDELEKKAKDLAKTLDFHKGEDIRLYDVSSRQPLYTYYLVASATGIRKVSGLAREMDEALEKTGLKVRHQEGKSDSEWILLDAGEVVVSVMTPECRERLHLESLYRDVPEISFEDGRVIQQWGEE